MALEQDVFFHKLFPFGRGNGAPVRDASEFRIIPERPFAASCAARQIVKMREPFLSARQHTAHDAILPVLRF